MTLAPCPFFCTAFQVIHTPAAAPDLCRASTTCRAPFQGVGIQERVHSPVGDESGKQMVPTSVSSAGRAARTGRRGTRSRTCTQPSGTALSSDTAVSLRR